ncbi:MAG: hypothetical protein IKT10_05475 [Clostridiales bacterium]|nr:hypothetical protein [Clostridiales bacterium]
MQVVSISVSTLLFPMIIIITLAVFFIYKAFYDKHTNKVLEGSETKKKKWIAPWGLALIVLGAQLILVAGFMFPLSMLMVDHSVVELSEDSPMHFDVSDSVKFVIDESNYGSGTTFNDDGITVTLYRQERTDKYEYYVILGEIEKTKNEPLMVFVSLGTDSQDYSAQTYLPVTSGSSKAYFKCEVLTGADAPASLRIGVNYGNHQEPADDNFEQDIKLTF